MSDEMHERTAVLILGMHRSGTSSVAGVLQRLGVDLGRSLLPPAPDNPKGFFESVHVQAFHDELLARLGSSWDDPSSLPPGWERDARLLPYRDRLAALIRRDFLPSLLWGVKDPRLCRLLPLWIDVLADFHVRVKAALVVRHPHEVAASLRERNGLDADQSVTLWLAHMLEAERHSRGLPRTVVMYDDVLSDWRRAMGRLRDELDLDFRPLSDELVADVSEFIDTDLNHHRRPFIGTLRAPQSASAQPVYEALINERFDAKAGRAALAQAAEQLALAERTAAPFVLYLRSRMLVGQAAVRHLTEEHRRRTETVTVRRLPHPGRNDACSCGSGQKFKKCCGRSVNV